MFARTEQNKEKIGLHGEHLQIEIGDQNDNGYLLFLAMPSKCSFKEGGIGTF